MSQGIVLRERAASFLIPSMKHDRQAAEEIVTPAHPRPAEEDRVTRTEEFEALYEAVADPWNISKRVSYYTTVWSWILSELRQKPQSVEDIGCGVGSFLFALQSVAPEVRAAGLEYSARAAESAWKLTGMRIRVGDIRQASAFDPGAPSDLVTLNDVLTYVGDEWRIGLTHCLRFLRPRYAVISWSDSPDNWILEYSKLVYGWRGGCARLYCVAQRTFDLPAELGWAVGQRFALYGVGYGCVRATTTAAG
jgi:SAM-dependent methyltransferase